MAAVLSADSTRGRGRRRGCGKHALCLTKAQIATIDKLGTTGKDWLTQALVGKVDKMENENGRVAIKPSRTDRKHSKAV
jgi:hypothetical protein